MKYKIKSILNNSITIEYRTNNGTLKELYVHVEEDWNKEQIETEIALQKSIEDKKDIKLNLAQYFFKGEELEFVPIISEQQQLEEEQRKFEEELKRIREEENQRFLDKIIEYRNTEVDYAQVRWYSYPSIEEQLDALYWMRQGVMEPIQKIDKQIEEIKQTYPKNQSTNITCGDLDTMFSDNRPTDYMNELKSRNIEVDFL